jgi:hypothetical protein
MQKRIILAGAAALLASAAIAGGQFPGLPGLSSYGPLQGTETVPADTGLAGGAQPQTISVPLAAFGAAQNRIVGGDFATNLWQRGTTPLSAATPTTATMSADRWWAYSSANVVTISKQTAAADTIPAYGLGAALRVSRPSGTNTSEICVGQTLDKAAAAPLLGKTAVLSFHALAGAGLSAVANNNIAVHVAYFTAADSAASQSTIQFAGGNSQTFALGTTTGYTAAVAGISLPGGSLGTVSSGIATIPISTTWTRYAVYAPIPTATAAGTAVTALGVKICYTPTSGTGGSTEWFEIAGVQLEAKPSGVTIPSAFEHRSPALEAAIQRTYSYVIVESGTAVNYRAPCAMSTTSIANCVIQFPQTMRIVPAMAYANGFTASATVASSSVTACTSLATSSTLTGTAATQDGVLVQCGSAAGFGAAGTAGFLWDAGTGSPAGRISASAEP